MQLIIKAENGNGNEINKHNSKTMTVTQKFGIYKLYTLRQMDLADQSARDMPFAYTHMYVKLFA